MKVTKEIMSALRELLMHNTQFEIQQKTGCSQQNISRYINGQRKRMTDDIWEKLYPAIEEYLPKKEQCHLTHDSCPFRDGTIDKLIFDKISRMTELEKVTILNSCVEVEQKRDCAKIA